MTVQFVTKEELISGLKSLQTMEWIESIRPGNPGGIGNTIDHLLGFSENNLPISDSAQWELKTHRAGSSSLITLLHKEPKPQGTVPRYLIPKFGWPDQTRVDELSFRQTLFADRLTDRGFGIEVDNDSRTINIFFDSGRVERHHNDWLRSVESRTGLGPLNPQPNWPIQELSLRVSTKMLNAFYVEVATKGSAKREMFRIEKVSTLQGFNTEGFLHAIEDGGVAIDFDARTGHNHGTKFRLRENFLPKLYAYVDAVV